MPTYKLHKNPGEQLGNVTAVAVLSEYLRSINKELVSLVLDGDSYNVMTTPELTAEEITHIGVEVL